MTKCFVIVQCSGDFPSDASSHPVRVFMDESRARSVFDALIAVFAKYQALVMKPPHYLRDDKGSANHNPACKAEYEALGFDADIYDSWEIEEADIDAALTPPPGTPTAASDMARLPKPADATTG